MSPEPESHESATAEPKGPSLTMAKARAAVHSDRVADAERGRARTASLPSLDELELTAEQIEEETVTVAQAAELTGVSVQAIDQLIVRGSLVAYRDTRGRRVITLVDLVESAPSRRQADRLAEAERLEFWSQDLHANPWPVALGGPFACPEWCTVCERARAAQTSPTPAEEPDSGPGR
jgi:excisionase family DNA binding protein